MRHAVSQLACINSQHPLRCLPDRLSHVKGMTLRCHLAAGRLHGAKDVRLNKLTSAATLLSRENTIQDFKSLYFQVTMYF